MSGWLFRGHSCPEWRLVPAVWRDNFSEFSRSNELYKHLAQEAATKPIAVDPWRSIGDEERPRLCEVIERLLAEYSLIRSFFLFASDLALSNQGSWPPIAERLQPDAANLLNEPDLYPQTIAQHYGIPTRLLDWTRDPLTALFFALENSHKSNTLTIWAFDDNLYQEFLKSKGQDFGLEPRLYTSMGGNETHSHLHAQRGAFTYIFRGELSFLQRGQYPAVDEIIPDHMMFKFIIPVEDATKRDLAVRLLRERRTKAHLMPDLRSCAEVAIANFRLGLNSDLSGTLW